MELLKKAIGAGSQKPIKPPGVLDDDYIKGELAQAAACYITPEMDRLYCTTNHAPADWPFPEELWHPTPDNRPEELAKAAYFLLAEINRQERRKQNG